MVAQGIAPDRQQTKRQVMPETTKAATLASARATCSDRLVAASDGVPEKQVHRWINEGGALLPQE